ncbi:MAG: electron transfer flavoprotein subunit alpha/FixB family protein, partial [Spirochaetales bacterium]|nr:electron transfer flavoprotein subunit alpha/FixB family protein [Spirochaetales bacterium]
LDIRENGELEQIRPAFGGNIMAHIKTPAHRPQFATVRYKIFSTPKREEQPSGEIEHFIMRKEKLTSRITMLDVHHKEKVEHLEDAEIIIAAGRGIGNPDNLELIQQLADLLDAQVAGTRPMVESGLIDPRKQIGLSGRTVRPRLLIACGISGSVQFAAGMKGSERIIAINSDPDAPIFETAHIGVVGDVLEILPRLISNIESKKSLAIEAINV